MNEKPGRAISRALAVFLAATPAVLAATPDSGGPLLSQRITVNNGTGDQFDPHVDQDLLVYSSAVDTLATGLTQEIRYYRFSTDTDLAVPNALPGGGTANDLLSDVDQGRIVFTRVTPNAVVIMLFDTATGALTELAPSFVAPSHRIGASLGSDTVAFVDYGLVGDGSGEIVVLDLATSQLRRLTNDSVYDVHPTVSSDGNVVTWERCPTFTNCDIQGATRSASGWSVQPLASSSRDEHAPVTDGGLIAFFRIDPAGATASNIVLVPAAGGAEVELEIPGEQWNPSIRGPIVAFESRVDPFGNSDIYLVDLRTNISFQVTQTPDVNESLNDVTVLPTGEVRLVWQAYDSPDVTHGNVYAATFSLPGLPPCRPIVQVESHYIPPGACQWYTSVTGLASGNGTVDVSLVSPAGATFDVLPTVGNNFFQPPGLIFPVGTLSFTARLPAGTEGGDLAVRLTFTPPLPLSLTRLFKVADRFGGTEMIDPARWTRADTSVSTIVTLVLTDGLFPLDRDATVNGLIVDPLAIGVMQNEPPVASAGGDQNVYLGQTALLSGSASDPEGDPLTYAWSLDGVPAGSTAALSDATSLAPSLTPDAVGTYHLSLVANDGHADSAASTMAINVSRNLPPVAEMSATPLAGSAPLEVTFDARASRDPEGGPLAYSWSFGDAAGGAVHTSTPTHTYGAAGSYTAVVTVTDSLGMTDEASAVVAVTAPNLPPVVSATATPNHGAESLDVHFSASATDVNQDPLAYSWDFGDPASGAGNASSLVNPVHSYVTAGTYTASVHVSDGVNPSVSASLTISVSSALTIDVTEAKVDRGERGRVEGRVSLRADFDYAGVPAATDVISVKFDGVTLLAVPFGDFEREAAGRYEYETRTQQATIDFDRGTIRVSRHRMLTGGIDNSNGIDIEVGFGAATGMDHLVMTGEKGKRDCDLSHKKDRD
jgi:PKD repeat protein